MIQENPNYFKPMTPVDPKGPWNHWDTALEFLAVLGVIILLLILFKYLRKFFLICSVLGYIWFR